MQISLPKTFKEKYLYHPNKYVVAVILILSIASFFFLDTSKFQSEQSAGDSQIIKAKVVQVLSEREPTKEDITFVTTAKVQELLVEVPDGGSIKQIHVVRF